MFSNVVNKKELSDVARDVRGLLEKYQGNKAAKNVLDRSKGLIDRAINMEIDSPLPNGFFPEEFWQDGDLYMFNDLEKSVARFNLLLMGAESIEAVKKSVQDIERQAKKEELELRDRLKR